MYKIGIDLGGTNVSGGVIDDKNEIIVKDNVLTRHNSEPELIAADIARMVFGVRRVSDASVYHVDPDGADLRGAHRRVR